MTKRRYIVSAPVNGSLAKALAMGVAISLITADAGEAWYKVKRTRQPLCPTTLTQEDMGACTEPELGE